MSEFYEQLDESEKKGYLERIYRNRPENLHGYQGCVNDPNMVYTPPVVADGPAEGIATCKHCDLPIRETHMGHVRNEWEHLNGLSFCEKSSNWAWPKSSPVEPADPVVEDEPSMYISMQHYRDILQKSLDLEKEIESLKASQPTPVVDPEDAEDEVDGRWIGAVCEYASTCDGPCAELHLHVELRMDPITELGYCDGCVTLMDSEIRMRLERKTEEADVAPVVVRPEETRLRKERDEWRRKYFEMERAQSRSIDHNGEHIKRIQRLERDKDELRSEIKSLTEQPAPLPSDQKETFEEWWKDFNKSEVARTFLGLGTAKAPFGSNDHFILRKCAQTAWNAAKGGTN